MKRLTAYQWTACVLILMGAAFSMPGYASNDEQQRLSDLSGQYSQLENQQELLEGQLGKAKTEREKRMAEIQRIDGQIQTASDQIAVLDERISLLETRVSRMQAEMDRRQQLIDSRFESFKKRLRALTSVPRASNLGIALVTDSYFEFITSQTMIERAAKYDRELLDGLSQEKQALENIRQEIQQDQDAVLQDRELLAKKRRSLVKDLDGAKKRIQDIALMEDLFLVNRDALSRQMKQVQAEIDAVYAALHGGADLSKYVGGDVVFGSMTHPAPELTQITSSYGLRFNRSNFHTGVDFSVAGAYGKAVVAANAGKVAFVNTAYTPGYGYGKYLILDHGGGITTLYAHNSAILVQEGQTVEKGQKIAQVGSTGWSTGPHCHFEVRVNGTHTDPMPYLGNS